MDAKRVLEIYQKMVDERGSMPSLWEEVIRYCYPQERPAYSSYGGDTSQNGWRRANPASSFPVVFTQRLGSSIHSNAFPANDYWFDFTIIGEDLNTDNELRSWCKQARDICHQKIRQGTNFYQESHAMMISLAALGTAGFYTGYKDGSLTFRNIPIHKNLYISSGSSGEIDTVAILHEYSAKEAVDEYGRENVSPDILKAFENNEPSDSKFSFVQFVYPKKLYGEKYRKSRFEKPYGDITVEKEVGKIVAVSQHSSFPFAVPRFLVYSDDLYGRSPAMNAMPDIKAVNCLFKNLLDATTRAIKPPVFMDGILSKNISIEAGAVNKINSFTSANIWTYPTPTNFPIGKELMATLLESLKGAFYIDVFQAIEQQKYMTATEVTERVRQKVESISPIITRIQKEFSSRVILRCLDLLIENGDVPPPPSQDGRNGFLKVGYISSLDAMIQQGIAAKTMNFINQVNLLGQAVNQLPDLTNTLDSDKIIQALGDANTLPADFFRSPAEVEFRRQQQAMQQQVMAQAQMNSLAAKSAADLSKADPERLEEVSEI